MLTPAPYTSSCENYFVENKYKYVFECAIDIAVLSAIELSDTELSDTKIASIDC
jgi:hypothetical protein